MKFGGTSVADGERIARVAEILEKYVKDGHELVVVVSALSGMTDQLIANASEVVNCAGKPPVEPFIAAIRTRHEKALRRAAPDFADEVGQVISSRLQSLENILSAINTLRELTPRSRDYIISFGERLSAPIVSAALRQRGIPSTALDGCEAGIITTPTHGDAIALPAGDTRIENRIVPLLATTVPVIMGFMGCTEQGNVTTLGRSGSDYSAAIVGAAIHADEIWIWTDVDGVMTSDPRLIKNARVLPTVSYLEAMELSYFGAKVLHSRSIEPAMRKDIPVLVKNTFNPDHPGTRILRQEHRDRRVVKAVTIIEKVALVAVTGVQMVGRPGVAKMIFSALADNGVNVMMISQGSSEANISLIIEEGHLDQAVDALAGIRRNGIVRDIIRNRDVVAIAVVGAGMAGTPGISGRIFTALGKAGVNVIMISQGSSEVNVSFVVRQQDGPKAVQILHDEFRLSEDHDE
ncbi:MAG: aspartate kinase [Methanomicrobiales archaeon]|nr:aspartate kinase [Methanomicrobiales archaeon]